MKAPRRVHNPAQETFDPSERAAALRKHESHEAPELRADAPNHPSAHRNGPAAPVQTRAQRKPVDDGCFALNLRLPNQFKFAVTMEALQAESAGEFVLHGRRDSRQAYLEHILLMHLEDLKEKHPNPKAR